MPQQYASTGVTPAINTRWARPSEAQTVFAAESGMPVAGTINLSERIKLRMVLIPPGSFDMGSGLGPYKEERPLHEVRISRPFYMGLYPVRQVEYEAVTGTNPSRFPGAHNPVERVTWRDAVTFCERASRLTVGSVRLPTEAEWEYACRAGATGEYYFGHSRWELDTHAWYGGARCGSRTHRVGQRVPNAWGLFDTLGNVWEWCQDFYGPDYYRRSPELDPQGPKEGSDRICRGGSWRNESVNCRCAYRRWFAPDSGSDDIGFRICLVPPAPGEDSGGSGPRLTMLRAASERLVRRFVPRPQREP